MTNMWDREVVSIREAAAMIGVSRSTVYLLLGENRLDSVRLNRRRLIKVNSIRRLLGESEVVE
jgi:excisionase family DNA binding protein